MSTLNAEPHEAIPSSGTTATSHSHSEAGGAPAGDGRRRAHTLQIVGLLILAAIVAIGVSVATDRSTGMLISSLGVLVLAASAIGLLLFRQRRTRQDAQQAFEGMQARASGFFESAMDPIVSIDENQRIVMFNAAAERVFRWPRRAVLGQPLDMLIPQRFHAVHHAHVDRFASTGVTSRRMDGLNALTGVRADGEEFPIEASISRHVENGRKVLTVMLRDITSRVRSEVLLSRSEARLLGILDSAMDGIITVDNRQKVVLFNVAAEKMFGYSRDEAIGAPLASFIPDRFRTTHAQHIERFSTTGVTSRRMGGARIVAGLRRNGEEFPIDASISQLAEGDAKFYTVILRDVSERMRTLESLTRSKEELRELATAAISAREEEQRRIARELHDELAQSMSALKMDISLIRAGSSPDNAALMKRLGRMENQIDATIAAMRRIAADLRPLLLDDLGLAAALASLVKEFGRRSGVRCKLSIPTSSLDLPPAQATAVFRIVQESLTNIDKHARASSVDVKVAVDDNGVTVAVQDDGVGFATDAPRKAQSYGLLGVRERAYLLAGDARVTSAPGRGTRVEVRLPVSSATAENR